jgi:hypothetical protein
MWWLALLNFLIEGVAAPYTLLFQPDQVAPASPLAHQALRGYAVILFAASALLLRTPHARDQLLAWLGYHAFSLVNILVSRGQAAHAFVHGVLACLFGAACVM